MNWVVIIVLIVLAFLFLRVKHMKHKIYMALVILFILFLYTTTTQVFHQNQADLKSTAGIFNALKIYWNWLVSVKDNFVSITGNAINQDWKLGNGSLIGELSE